MHDFLHSEAFRTIYLSLMGFFFGYSIASYQKFLKATDEKIRKRQKKEQFASLGIFLTMLVIFGAYMIYLGMQ